MRHTLDFRAILDEWARGWLRLCVFLILSIGIAIGYLHIAMYRYTISMELASTDHTISPSLGENFSFLSGGAAFGLREDLNMELFLAEMTSIEVAEQLAADPNIVRVLFESRWDAQRGQWRAPNSNTAKIKKWIGLPDRVDGTPTAYDVQEFLKKNLGIERATTSPVTTIVLKHKDRQFAETLLQKAYALADGTLRARAVERAQQRVDFLQDYLTKSTVTEYRQQLVLGLMTEIKTVMAGKLPSAFAVYVVSGPSSSDLPTSPSARSVLFGTALAGLALGSASIFLFPASRRRRQALASGFGGVETEPLYSSLNADESATPS